ncbi:NAD-dependent protein deacylase SRT2 [Hondaea fermentalgiana]|uniref:NAD-dependent protein deacylase SRT2 n=1 Tax=Hondaea fermentalgiana TaxID=2315210 RepID=A0A2R5GS37_9STRA|nr:NAD-dependent protein deacylase SRT2 [Hondaea fermentalgiana]|eukprot:GBG31161.1 NAD-dependent protein deacylase SRT2 [Hondaea fermentalgiana]
MASFVPPAARSKLRAATLQELVSFFRHGASAGHETRPGRICVLSGAGVSTESGIPDYRSPEGSYSRGHKPMSHQDFIKSGARRKRYWARAVVAQKHFREAKPNACHTAIAALEHAGFVSRVITQNVDRLHTMAGSSNVLELHGHGHGVHCLSCGTEYSRHEYQDKIYSVNKGWFDLHLDPNDFVDIRADGDAHLDITDYDNFFVPSCSQCGGTIMPTIVFFGGTVPAHVKQASFDAVKDADRLLVVGSSVTVWSSFRLCKAAKDQGKELAILNVGETRADPIADFKIDEVTCGQALTELTQDLLGPPSAWPGVSFSSSTSASAR